MYCIHNRCKILPTASAQVKKFKWKWSSFRGLPPPLINWSNYLMHDPTRRPKNPPRACIQRRLIKLVDATSWSSVLKHGWVQVKAGNSLLKMTWTGMWLLLLRCAQAITGLQTGIIQKQLLVGLATLFRRKHKELPKHKKPWKILKFGFHLLAYVSY